MTPPLDEEAEREESRSLEAQSRDELVNDGCPPCYPPYLEVPLQHVPEKFKAITSYWKSFPGTGDVVLRAQLSDWQKFRVFQRRVRQYYQQTSFGAFVNKACKRRGKHNLRGDIRLRFDVNQQGRVENWMEFQDYHLQLHEALEKEREDLRRSYGMSKEGENIDSRGFDRAAKAYQQRLEYAEWKLQQHETLLQWTEQERVAMDVSYPILAEEDCNEMGASPKLVQATYASSRRKARAERRKVLDNVKILDAKWKERKRQVRKRTTSGPESAVHESAVVPQSGIQQEIEGRQAEHRPIKTEAPPCQHPLQRVSKVARFTHANAKSQTGRFSEAMHKRCPCQCWQPLRRSQLTCEGVRTRSGRISRRPVRWAPE